MKIFFLLLAFQILSKILYAQILQYTLNSPTQEENGEFGYSIVILQDLNNDQYAEFAVSAPGDVSNGYNFAGKVFIHNGSDGSLIQTLDAPIPQSSARFGTTLTRLQDRTGDGFDELCVGVPFYNLSSYPDAGIVFCFNIITGSLIFTLQSPTPSSYHYFGYSITEIPDTNFDGIKEFAVGEVGAGLVYVYNGLTNQLLYTLSPPIQENCISFGHSISGVPDINGDNRGDLIVGAFCQNQVFVFSGYNGSVLDTISSGVLADSEGFGYSVLGVPDINQDGRGDILVGAPYANVYSTTNSGKVYLLSGSNGSFIRTFEQPIPTIDAWFGLSIANLNDLNQDGILEIGISATNELINDTTFLGRVYIFSIDGNSFSSISPIQIQHNSRFGFSLAGGVNISGSSNKDFLIGRPHFNNNLVQQVGQVYLYEVSLNDLSTESNIVPQQSVMLLYPNPFNHTLSISLQKQSKPVEIHILNIYGQKLETIYKGNVENEITVYYQPKRISSGLYFVSMSTPHQQTLQKVLYLR